MASRRSRIRAQPKIGGQRKNVPIVQSMPSSEYEPSHELCSVVNEPLPSQHDTIGATISGDIDSENLISAEKIDTFSIMTTEIKETVTSSCNENIENSTSINTSKRRRITNSEVKIGTQRKSMKELVPSDATSVTENSDSVSLNSAAGSSDVSMTTESLILECFKNIAKLNEESYKEDTVKTEVIQPTIPKTSEYSREFENSIKIAINTQSNSEISTIINSENLDAGEKFETPSVISTEIKETVTSNYNENTENSSAKNIAKRRRITKPMIKITTLRKTAKEDTSATETAEPMTSKIVKGGLPNNETIPIETAESMIYETLVSKDTSSTETAESTVSKTVKEASPSENTVIAKNVSNCSEYSSEISMDTESLIIKCFKTVMKAKKESYCEDTSKTEVIKSIISEASDYSCELENAIKMKEKPPATISNNIIFTNYDSEIKETVATSCTKNIENSSQKNIAKRRRITEPVVKTNYRGKCVKEAVPSEENCIVETAESMVSKTIEEALISEENLVVETADSVISKTVKEGVLSEENVAMEIAESIISKTVKEGVLSEENVAMEIAEFTISKTIEEAVLSEENLVMETAESVISKTVKEAVLSEENVAMEIAESIISKTVKEGVLSEENVAMEIAESMISKTIEEAVLSEENVAMEIAESMISKTIEEAVLSEENVAMEIAESIISKTVEEAVPSKDTFSTEIAESTNSKTVKETVPSEETIFTENADISSEISMDPESLKIKCFKTNPEANKDSHGKDTSKTKVVKPITSKTVDYSRGLENAIKITNTEKSPTTISINNVVTNNDDSEIKKTNAKSCNENIANSSLKNIRKRRRITKLAVKINYTGKCMKKAIPREENFTMETAECTSLKTVGEAVLTKDTSVTETGAVPSEEIFAMETADCTTSSNPEHSRKISMDTEQLTSKCFKNDSSGCQITNLTKISTHNEDTSKTEAIKTMIPITAESTMEFENGSSLANKQQPITTIDNNVVVSDSDNSLFDLLEDLHDSVIDSYIETSPLESQKRNSMEVNDSEYERNQPEAQILLSVESTPAKNIPNDSAMIFENHEDSSRPKSKQVTQSQRYNQKKREFAQKCQTMDKSKMTIGDMIFYNPSTNPMKSIQNRCNNISIAHIEEAECVDDLSQTAENEVENYPAVQVKIGLNGEVIVDEESLVISRTDVERNLKKLANSSVIYDDGFDITSRTSNKKIRNKTWRPDDTKKFYEVLRETGINFSMMQIHFPERSWDNLKRKFKKEEKVNSDLIDKILKQHKLFDPNALEKELQLEKEAEEKKKLQQKKNQKRPKKNSVINIFDSSDEDENEEQAEDRVNNGLLYMAMKADPDIIKQTNLQPVQAYLNSKKKKKKK